MYAVPLLRFYLCQCKQLSASRDTDKSKFQQNSVMTLQDCKTIAILF
jgi:hypothetical protein